jgi:urease accessory protein
MLQRSMAMRGRKYLVGASLALATVVVTAAPAEAHHMMGGKTPSTFFEGLLSGLGHPVIGIDHLAFIVAIGVAAGVAGLSLAIPVLFIVASALGVAAHVYGVTLPGVEALVAFSVLLVGAVIALGRSVRTPVWGALFAVGGLLHGYAFGESIYGAEASPLSAYLLGLAVIQAAIVAGVAMLARRSGGRTLEPRLAGAAIAGIGFAILAGQMLPA